MSEASDNLLDDQEDEQNEVIDPVPPVTAATAAPAPVSALLTVEDKNSPVFKKRPLTPVEVAVRNSTLGNDSKDLCLVLDSSVEDSPIFRKKNSSVSAKPQNSSELIKSLIDEEEEDIGNVTTTVEMANSTSGEENCDATGNLDEKKTETTVIKDINTSISVRRRSKTPEDILTTNSTFKDVLSNSTRTEIIAEVVSPVKSVGGDSGPLLPETQALKGDEEEFSDEGLEDLEIDDGDTKIKEAESDDKKEETENVQEELQLGRGRRSKQLTQKAKEVLNGKDQSNVDVIGVSEDKNDSMVDKKGSVDATIKKSEKRKSWKLASTVSAGPSNKTSPAEPKPIPTPSEGNISAGTGELVETPLATVAKRLQRGKRRTSRVSARVAEVEVKKVITENAEKILEVEPTDTEVAETQLWSNPTKNAEPQQDDEKETQPYSVDAEVLLPGESGVDVDTEAETQPLEETVTEEPVMKRSKIVAAPPRKTRGGAKVYKPPLEEESKCAVPARSGRRSAIQAIAELQPSIEVKQTSRGRSKKLPEPKQDNEEEPIVEKSMLNKLGRRRKTLKIPSSLLIESPVPEDMFVDDADNIPSPLTNGTPLIPLKTKATRKGRSKAPEVKVEEVEDCEQEDEPLEKKRTVRSGRGARTATARTGNAQSVKPEPCQGSIAGPSRKSIDDFSPRSKTKMESKPSKPEKGNRGKRKSDKITLEKTEAQTENKEDTEAKAQKSEIAEEMVPEPAAIKGRGRGRRSTRPET